LLGRKDGRCVGLTTLLTLFANCLEIWEPQHPGTLRACTGFALLLRVKFIMEIRSRRTNLTGHVVYDTLDVDKFIGKFAREN